MIAKFCMIAFLDLEFRDLQSVFILERSNEAKLHGAFDGFFRFIVWRVRPGTTY
jgi:hypothetical protein